MMTKGWRFAVLTGRKQDPRLFDDANQLSLHFKDEKNMLQSKSIANICLPKLEWPLPDKCSSVNGEAFH